MIAVGARLPDITLRRAADGAPVALSSPARGEPAILFLPADAAGFREYTDRFVQAAGALRLWYGRPILVGEAGDSLPAAADADAPELLLDPGDELRRRLGLSPLRAAVLIADRWGQVYHVAEAEEESGLPSIEDVEEWLKFLATQCPECGVIDEPGYGEWSLT